MARTAFVFAFKFGVLLVLSAWVFESMFRVVAPSYAAFAFGVFVFGLACGAVSALWITRS
jgi:hypothetical protein